MLAACPQLRDEDFRTLPSDGLSRPDAGGAFGPPLERDDGVVPAADARALRAALAQRYGFDTAERTCTSPLPHPTTR
jgi:hypothetical protein